MVRWMCMALLLALVGGGQMEGSEMAKQLVRPGETATVTISASVGEGGKHGAVTLTRAELRRPDGSVLDLLPVDAILREEGTGSGGTGTVGSPPSFSAGGGPGGEDVYSVALGTGEASDISVGNFLRSTTANLGGIYEVLHKSSDTLKLAAGTGEMDIANGAAVEKVTPSGKYTIEIEVDYADLDAQDCVLVVRIAGADADARDDAPAITTAFSDEARLAVGPGSPLALTVALTSAVA